jgi:fibronectin type 3 domain-containing protein
MSIRKCITSTRQLLGGALAAAGALLLPCAAQANTFYVAPTGSDTNTGNLTAPFATIMRAQTAAAANDTVFLRGGNYTLTNLQITGNDASYYYVNTFTKSGITYIAFPGEDPVFDFSQVQPSSMPVNLRVCAFRINASNITLQGFEIIGVQITIPTVHTQSECIRIDSGNNNVLRYLKMHNGMGIGVYIINHSGNNLIENCDAHDNAGLDSGSIGNIDGFGCHVKAGSTGNIFRYDRSWNNSDDGYDCINCAESVTFDHCWSYHNGFQGGDGNGFKSGGWGSTAQNAIPNPVPNHVLKYCLSAGNSSHGYYANHQPGQSATWTYNTSYNNSVDFDMLERTPPDYTSTVDQTDANDTAGVSEVMHYNLGFDARDGETGDLNETGSSLITNNSFSLSVTANNAQFQSVDPTQMTLPRQADGSLPVITFMHLVSGSNCAGLGCFESAPLGLNAVASSGHVSLTWTSVLGAMAYIVNRSTTSGGNYTAISGNLTTGNYTDTTAVNGTKYFYVVTASNGEDTSPNSTEVNATPIAAPTGLTATPGNGNVTLTWTASTGASNYTVQRSTTNGSGYTTITTGVTATTYKDTTAVNGTTYFYVVIAANANGSSGNSAQTSTTPLPPAPSAPTGLIAAPGNGTVALSWTASSGATSYIVQRSSTSGSGYANVSGTVATASFTDTGLTNGDTYYYVVAAANIGGTSANSAQVSATPTQTLTQWTSAAFPGQSDQAIIGPKANPSGDGIPNLLKYFFGLSPALTATSPPVTSSDDNSGHVVLTFRLSKNLTGVTYQIQQSSNLASWSDTGLQGMVVSDQGTYYLMQAAVPMGSNPNLYLRVSVSQGD